MSDRDSEIVRIAMEMWRANSPWADIVKAIGMSRQRIAQILKESGISLMGERDRMISEGVALIIREAQASGDTLSAHRIYMALKERGIRTTSGRVSQELRTAHTIIPRVRSGHPPMVGPPDTLHCPKCGWQPITSFRRKVQAMGKNGYLCRACMSARYRRQRYGDSGPLMGEAKETGASE